MADGLPKIGAVAEIQNLSGFLSAVRSINSGLAGATQAAQGLAAVGGAASAALTPLSAVMTALTAAAAVAAAGILALVGGMSLVGSTGLAMNSNLEQTEIRLQTLTGIGKETLAWVRQLSIVTPFTTDTLSKSLAMARAYGFSTTEAKKYLVTLGDADAALAGHGQVLEAATRALGQMNAATRVNAQDMRQLTEAGIPAWQILAEKMGLSTAEVRKMSEEGKLFANDVVPLLVEGINERFGGAMATQARTAQGLFDTLREGLQLAASDITLPAFDKLKDILVGITDEITQPGTGFHDLILQISDLMREIFADFDASQVISGFRDIVREATEVVRFIREVRYELLGLSREDLLAGATEQIRRNNVELSNSLSRMAMAHAATVESLNEQIDDAGSTTQRALSDIADKYADKAASIQGRMGKIASQFSDQMEKLDRDLARKLADNQQALQDKLESMAQSHADKRASIEQSISDENFSHDERIADLRDRLEEQTTDTHTRFADQREALNKKLAAAQTVAQKAAIQADIVALDAEEQAAIAKLEEREAKEEARVQAKHDRQIAMLQKRLADEDAEYARSVEKEKVRSAEREARIKEDNAVAVEELKKRIGQEMGELAAQQSGLAAQRAQEEKDVKDSYDRQVAALKGKIKEEDEAYAKQQEERKRDAEKENQRVLDDTAKLADDLDKGPAKLVAAALMGMLLFSPAGSLFVSDSWAGGGASIIAGLTAGITGNIPGLVSVALDAAMRMTSALSGIKLPSWLTPGSPTPFEVGLRGISSAMSDLSGLHLPHFSAQINHLVAGGVGSASTVPVVTPAPRVVVQGGSTTIDRRINVNANYRQTQSPARIMDDLRLATMLHRK